MKSFFGIYVICLVLVITSFFFGLPELMYKNYYLFAAVIALVLAVAVKIWYHLETKLEDLEKRLQDLENKESQS